MQLIHRLWFNLNGVDTLKIWVDAARSMPYVQLNGVSDYIIRVDAAAKMLHLGLLDEELERMRKQATPI